MLRRTGFKKAELKRERVAPIPLDPKHRRNVSMGPAVLTAAPKTVTRQTKTADDRRHMDAVAQLGCVVCKRVFNVFTPLVELHHPRRGAGMGQRACHEDVIGLCPEHHRGNTGLHGLGTKGFAAYYGFTEADLLEDVRQMLAA